MALSDREPATQQERNELIWAVTMALTSIKVDAGTAMDVLTFALASVVAAVEGLSLDDIEYWAKGKHADELIEIVRKARRDGILDPASLGKRH